MNRRVLLFAVTAAALTPSLVRAQGTAPAATAAPTRPAPPPQAPLTPAEQAWVTQVTTTLPKLYGTTADAAKAGYFRYNNEDRTGAISWINPKYADSPDVAHPSQLWYDVNGRLLGADYTQSKSKAPDGPTLFGLQRARFHNVSLHVHLGLKNPDGSVTYGLAVPASAFQAAGGDPLNPKADVLVKMGKVKSADEVAFIVPVTENWDAQVWAIPNPDGPFADANPTVKRSATQSGSGERPL